MSCRVGATTRGVGFLPLQPYAVGRSWRLNISLSLSSSLAGHLQTATGFSGRSCVTVIVEPMNHESCPINGREVKWKDLIGRWQS